MGCAGGVGGAWIDREAVGCDAARMLLGYELRRGEQGGVRLAKHGAMQGGGHKCMLCWVDGE